MNVDVLRRKLWDPLLSGGGFPFNPSLKRDFAERKDIMQTVPETHSMCLVQCNEYLSSIALTSTSQTEDINPAIMVYIKPQKL